MYREKMAKICKKKTIFYALIKIIMYITAIFLCTKFPTAVYLLAAMVLEEIVSIVTNKHVKNESNRIYSNISNENDRFFANINNKSIPKTNINEIEKVNNDNKSTICNLFTLIVLIILVVYQNVTYFVAGIMIAVAITILNIKIIKELLKKIKATSKIKNIKHKKIIITALIVGLLTYMISGVILAYKDQPVIDKKLQEQLVQNDIWKQRTSYERGKVIEDNNQALIERVRLIKSAKKKITMSTFAFHSDNSGKVMIGALLEAANKGIDVKIVVDGMESWTAMEWNPYFYALSLNENVNLKIYNKVNPLLSYKSMGRMHDKYLIADDKTYIIGGRNTFDYFLGDFSKYKNYDRDILIYSEKDDKTASVYDLESYFDKIWNYKECGLYHNSNFNKYKVSVKNAITDIENSYNKFYEKYKKEINNTDYKKDTVKINNVALLSNPTDYKAKKPILWYNLCSLMESAREKVKIHTPYIICNGYMYKGLTTVADKVPQVTVMTNSVANNGNPFGAADYSKNKQNILNTGVSILEYEGGMSYHGKSVLIDDNISIIGSFNMDMRSAYLDTELMLVVDSKDINKSLLKSMEKYEASATVSKKDGTYENPNNVKRVKLSQKKKLRINIIKKFFYNLRFLF